MADIEEVRLKPDTTYEVDGLQLWSLSTFGTTSFMITVVILQYIQGSLRERFSSLGKGIGLLLFGNGLLLFVPLMVVLLVIAVTSEQMRAMQLLAFVAIGSVIGGAVAFVIGALVGFLYGLAEAFLLGLSDRIYRWAAQ